MTKAVTYPDDRIWPLRLTLKAFFSFVFLKMMLTSILDWLPFCHC